jgi:hypothetical protein
MVTATCLSQASEERMSIHMFDRTWSRTRRCEKVGIAFGEPDRWCRNAALDPWVGGCEISLCQKWVIRVLVGSLIEYMYCTRLSICRATLLPSLSSVLGWHLSEDCRIACSSCPSMSAELLSTVDGWDCVVCRSSDAYLMIDLTIIECRMIPFLLLRIHHSRLGLMIGSLSNVYCLFDLKSQ